LAGLLIASALLHAGVIAAGLTVYGKRPPPEPPPMRIRTVAKQLELPAAEPLPEAAEPEPTQDPPPEEPPPEAPRPERVPKDQRVEKIDKLRPRTPKQLERPRPTSDAPPTDGPPPLFELSGDAVSAAGTVAVPVNPDGPGTPNAAPGIKGKRGVSGPAPGAPPVQPHEPARSWEITAEAEPLNDTDFEPDYPAPERARGAEAVVVVAVDIDAAGAVVGTDIVRSGGGGFDRAAQAYCRKLLFRPAKAGDTPVATRIEWTVWFRYRNE